MTSRIDLARVGTLLIALVAAPGCAEQPLRASPPAPGTVAEPVPPAPPAHHAAPRRVDVTASDPWGRRENVSIPDDTLQTCIRDAPAGTQGWLLLRVDFEVLPRPARVAVVEREGLDDAITSCLVAAVAGHDELEHLGPTRFVYLTAQ